MGELSIETRQRMHDHGRALARMGRSEQDLEASVTRASQNCGWEAAQAIAEGYSAGKKSMSVIGEPRRRSYQDGMFAYNSGKPNNPPPYVMGNGYKKGYSKYQQDAWCAGWLAAEKADLVRRKHSTLVCLSTPSSRDESGFYRLKTMMEADRIAPFKAIVVDSTQQLDSIITKNLPLRSGLNEPKEQTMSKSNLAYLFASLLPNVVTVSVQFSGTPYRTYTYKALESQGVKVGDMVVVDSPNSGPTLVQVVGVGTIDNLEPEAYNGYKWIVGKVDMGDYSDIREREQKFVEKVAEARRKAEREAQVKVLAEQLGGMDALKALIGELTGEKPAKPHAMPESPSDPDSYAQE